MSPVVDIWQPRSDADVTPGEAQSRCNVCGVTIRQQVATVADERRFVNAVSSHRIEHVDDRGRMAMPVCSCRPFITHGANVVEPTTSGVELDPRCPSHGTD